MAQESHAGRTEINEADSLIFLLSIWIKAKRPRYAES